MPRHQIFMVSVVILLGQFFSFQHIIADELWNPEIKKIVYKAEQVRGNDSLDAIIYLYDTEYIVKQGDNNILNLHIIGKIQSKAARKDYSQFAFPYNSYYTKPHLNFARTINNDISTDISRDAVQILTNPVFEGSIQYSDSRVLAFSLPATKVGSIFEINLTFEKINPIIKNEFFKQHGFNYVHMNLISPYEPRIDRVYYSRYTVRHPRNIELNVATKNADIPHRVTKTDNSQAYVWEMKNVPSIPIEENMPFLGRIVPEVAAKFGVGPNYFIY
jgi:hypothetical protein